MFDFLSSVQDAVWSFDISKQRFLYVNNRFSELFGLSEEEVEKYPFSWRRQVHPDDYVYVKQATENVYRGERIEIEYRILVDGRVRWLHDKKSPVFDDRGNVTIIAGTTSDITARKEAQIKLEESEYTFRYLFVNNPNPLWIYDLETLQFLAVNHTAVQEYGYSEEEFLSMTILDIRPQEEIPRLLSSVRRIRRKYSQSEGWKHVRKDGSVIYVNISGHGIEYRQRSAELVMVHDVTAEVKSREEMMLSKMNLDALINNIQDLIWSVDKNYLILSANASFKELCELSFGRRLETGDSVLVSTSANSKIREWQVYYDRVLKGEKVMFNTIVQAMKGRTFEIRMRPIKHDAEVVGAVCLGRDIQNRLDFEKRMIAQNTELKEIVSLASHEIRGPVTSLMGLVNLFNKENPADPFNAIIIDQTREATRQLDEVIHKIVEKSYSITVDNAATYSAQQNLSDYE